MPSPARPRIVVHIGEPQTGTTALHRLIWRRRGVLAKQGVLLPGPHAAAHRRAADDLRDLETPSTGSPVRAWDDLAVKALTAPRVSLIAHASLAAADESQARRAVRSLAAAEVHVVATVADPLRLLAAGWQDAVQQGGTTDWPDWLDAVTGAEPSHDCPARQRFWSVHDTSAVLRRWAADLPADRVHVIPVPAGADALAVTWTGLAGVLGVDPTAVEVTAAGNSGLAVADVELLRRLQLRLAAGSQEPGTAAVTDRLARTVLATRAATESPRLPAATFEWAARRGEALVTELAASGYDIVGDLDDLRPRPLPAAGRSPAAVPPQELLEVALTALDAFVRAEARPQTDRPAPAPTFRAAARAAVQRRPVLDQLVRRARAAVAARSGGAAR